MYGNRTRASSNSIALGGPLDHRGGVDRECIVAPVGLDMIDDDLTARPLGPVEYQSVGDAHQPVSQRGLAAVLLASFQSPHDRVLHDVRRQMRIVGDTEGISVEVVDVLRQLVGLEPDRPVGHRRQCDAWSRLPLVRIPSTE